MTTPLAARSTLPRTSTSMRTLCRSARWTTLLLSLFACAAGIPNAMTARTATNGCNLGKATSSRVQSYKQYRHAVDSNSTRSEGGGTSATIRCVSSRLGSIVLIALGFLAGLVLVSFDHLLPETSIHSGATRWVVVYVDWVAPPLAGVMVAGALLYAQRSRRLPAAQRAAGEALAGRARAEGLAERLAGTERRQAIWVVAAAVAHDLKNPLHNLQLLVEEVSEENDPALRAELLARIRENVERASERLSELSRAGQRPKDTVDQVVDLASTLDELHERLKPTVQATRAVLDIDCPRGLAA